MNKSSHVNYPEISEWTEGKFGDTTFLTSDALFWADMGKESSGDAS